jgi:hypothetical protein
MENILEIFNQQIYAVLNECQVTQTPTVCNLISTKEGKKKIFELIQKMVVKQKLSIAEAINEIEMEYSLNSSER